MTSRAIALIGILILLASGPGVALARPPESAPNPLKPEEIIALRRAYGLRSDAVFVTSLGDQPSPLLGIPLSSSEENDLERRQRVQDGLGPINDALRRMPGSAGLYIEQSSGGTLTVNLTKTATDQERQSLRAAAPAEAVVAIRTVAYSMSELDEVHRSLEVLAAAQPSDRHMGIGAIGTDIVENVVRVGVVAADRSAVEPDLIARFGDRIRIFDDEAVSNNVCSSASSCTPYRAGLQIYTSSGATCTSAFMTKNVVSATYYLLTAGHCATMNTAWKHDEVQVGTVVRRSYSEHATNDSEGISRAGTTGHKNWIFVTSGEPSRTVTSKEAQNGGVTGSGVCISPDPPNIPA